MSDMYYIYNYEVSLKGEVIRYGVGFASEDAARRAASEEIRTLINSVEYNHLFYEDFEYSIEEVPVL